MPQLTDIEKLYTELSDLGGEIPTVAGWGEKNEPFEALQEKPLHASLERDRDSAQPTQSDSAQSAPTDSTPQETTGDQLPQVIDDLSAEGMVLDTLAATTTDASIGTPDAAPGDARKNEDELLSKALGGLSPQLKNEIIKILEDPRVNKASAAVLIDDLITNRPTRRIRETVRQIQEGRQPIPVGLRGRGQHYRDQQSAVRLSLRALLVSIAVMAFLFGAWRFIYRPVSSHILYLNARTAIQHNRLDAGDTLFRRAREEHVFRRQLLGIANAYANRDALQHADDYFRQYIEEYPGDMDGFVQYVEFIAYRVGDTERARALATEKFEQGDENRALTRLLGDLHLEQGDRNNPLSYEEARYHYAYLLEKYGIDRDSLSNMLRFFIRTRNNPEIETIATILRPKDYPLLRPIVLSELIDYLLSIDDIEQIDHILKNIALSDIQHAGVHLQAARYFARIRNAPASEESLRNADAIFRTIPQKNRYEEELFIRLQETWARLAVEDGDFERALPLYNNAIAQFQDSIEKGLIVPRAFFGSLYAGLGDIYYVIGAYDLALQNYRLAQRQLYQSTHMDYHIGSIYYRNFAYQQAAQSFDGIISSVRNRPISIMDKNTLYALANSLFLLDGHAAALGYYRELITLLEREISPDPLSIDQDDIRNRDIIEMLIATYNNAGVSYARLYQLEGDPRYQQKSLVHLQRANEQYADYARNSNADTPASILSTPYRNSFAQLHSNQEELQIYRALPPNIGEEFLFIDEGVASASSLSDPRVRHIEFP